MKKVLLSGIIVGIFLISIVTYGIAPAFSESSTDQNFSVEPKKTHSYVFNFDSSYRTASIHIQIEGKKDNQIQIEIFDPNKNVVEKLGIFGEYTFELDEPELIGIYEIKFYNPTSEIKHVGILEVSVSKITVERGSGCLIATATYGSELAPQVQQLREIRDNVLLETESGSAFMESFNQFYYSFSPGIADLERENPIFKEAVKLAITPLLTSLSILNYVDVDSEETVLGYGISLILLNVGMYFVLPAIVIHRVRKLV